MWTTLVPLIAQYGIPFAQKIWALMTSNVPPTAADWEVLNTLAAQNARTQVLLALARNGVDPSSPQGVALLALTPA